ncbi:MAG TPA: outer membrane beta-barrel protein [Candidatus Eisenbacteria bacterium]
MRSLKIALCVVVAAGALGVIAPPRAGAGGYSLTVSGGAGMPTSDQATLYDTGWNVSGSVDKAMGPLWSAGLDLGYNTWQGSTAFDGTLTAASYLLGAAPGSTMSATFTSLRYGLHATVTPPIIGPIHPFARAGVGGYDLTETTSSTDPAFTNSALIMDRSKTLFGWNLGAGVDFAAAPTLSIGVMGSYHDVASDKDFGVNTTWFDVEGRLTFHVPLAK